MKFEGAIFDLDGTLTDSMYIWNEAPKALVRQFGGQPPEDLAEDIKEMGRREASEYMVARFSLPCTPEQVMDGVNDLVTDEYRDRVPMKLAFSSLQYGSKSRPDVYFASARSLGSAPEHTIVFEDALHAARTAKEAGFLVAGVYDPSAEGDQEALKKICDWYLPRLDDPEFLELLK